MRLGVDFNILNQKGTPAFYSDIFANRPAAGFAGRVFISTDTGAIYEDTGSAWTLIADAGAGTTGTLQQVTTNGNTTTNAISVQGINIGTGNNNIAQNTGLGTSTLNGVTTGGGNTAVGYGTLQFDTNGSANTAVGNVALNINSTGGANTAIGSQSLTNSNANRNTAIGYQSGNGISSGSDNIFVGYQSGISINTGNYNTIVGNYAGSATLANNVVLSDGQGNVRFIDNNGSAGIPSKLAVGSQSITSQFPNTQFYSGLPNPSESHSYNIGVTGTAQANASVSTQWGVGVYGAGYTNGATRSAGVTGDGEVTASADTGSAIGVRGYALATHAGGFNIGLYGDAQNGASNYALYMNNGGIFSATAQTWTLANTQQSALNIQSGLLNIDTVHNAVGIGTTATTTNSAKLVVYSATSDNQIVSAGTAPSLRLYDALTSPTVVGFMGMSAAANNFILGSAAGDMCIGTSTAGKIYIGSGSTTVSPAITILNSGKIGIGTTTPTTLLTIQGTGTSAYNNYVNTTSNKDFWAGVDSNGYILYDNINSAYRMVIKDNGNLLIGTTTDSGQKLQVNGTGTFIGGLSISDFGNIQSKVTSIPSSTTQTVTITGTLNGAIQIMVSMYGNGSGSQSYAMWIGGGYLNGGTLPYTQLARVNGGTTTISAITSNASSTVFTIQNNFGFNTADATITIISCSANRTPITITIT